MANTADKWPIMGILLYQRHTSDKANRLLSFLRLKSALLRIVGIESGEERISFVVPGSLMEDKDIWLCLCTLDRPNEILVVPLISELQENELLIKLEIIRGKITQPWTTLLGYANYIRCCRRRGQLPRAQILCLRRPLAKDSFLLETTASEQLFRVTSQDNLIKSKITKIFVGGTEKTRRLRKDFLLKILDEKDSEHGSALEEFEEQVLKENLSLFESTQRIPGNKIVVPRIVEKFGDAMDGETKRFLVSSKNVEVFACKNLSSDFDYALPGSGVWKAVERELNASVIWHLRRCRNIVGDNPWVTSRHHSEEVNVFTSQKGRKVNLNRRDKKNLHLLGGIMLGEVAHILLFNEQNGVRSDFESVGLQPDLILYLTKDLPEYILKVSNFRNRNAHIVAMSKRDYHHLLKLVLEPENKPEKSLLGKILSLKKKLKLI